MAFNKDTILALNDLDPVAVDVPEWNTTLFVKSLSIAKRKEVMNKIKNNEASDETVCLFLVNTVCDESNKLIFTEDDAKNLLEKNAAAIERLWLAARQANGIGFEVADIKKK